MASYMVKVVERHVDTLMVEAGSQEEAEAIAKEISVCAFEMVLDVECKEIK